MTILNPNQLPNANAQFIAYGPQERIADPFGGDDPITIRPQVFVRYYRDIKIKDLRTPREDTLNVVLDPESVGLSKEFGAYMNADDPVVAYLREQFEAGNPVDIGLEYVRNKKAKDTGELISPALPIHALRGANAPDGSGDNSTMMGVAGNHISSKVALVNGRSTTVVKSDPTEWQVLNSNRKGDLPPEGWKALRDPEDWTKVGAITPKAGTPSSPAQQNNQGGTGGIDPNTLAKIIRSEVRLALKDYGESLREEEAATRGNPTTRQSNGTAEGKPWNVRVNKDHLNLGSYLVAGESYALRWAYSYLQVHADETLGADEDLLWAAAEELAGLSQSIADRVQSAAYNGEVRADRVSASFKEATTWVRFQIENAYPFETSEHFDVDEWFNSVGKAATQCLKQAEVNAETFLDERYAQPQQKSIQPQQGQQQPEQDQQQGEEDLRPVVDAFLQMLTRSWTDRDAIRNLAGEAKEKGILTLPVWANPHEGQFAVEKFDGAQELTIGDLTKRQHATLGQQEAQQQPEQGQAEQTQPAEQANPPTQAAPAEQGQPEYTVQHIAAALAKATTEAEVAAIYGEARDRNFLATEVAAKKGEGTFGIAPVSPNTDGAEQMALGAVFDAIRQGMDVQSKADPQPEEGPASTPEPQQEEEPQNDPAPEEDAPVPTSQPAPATASTEGSHEQDIAERAAEATTPEEIKALYQEAQDAGIERNTISIRGKSGPLGAFLSSRQKRVRSAA